MCRQTLSVFLAVASVVIVEALNIGPCRPVKTDDLNLKTWSGIRYSNVISYNPGVGCIYHNRSVVVPKENPTVEYTILEERFVYTENGTLNDRNLRATYVAKGHYTYTWDADGILLELNVYTTYFDLPNLECHFTCSDNELVKAGQPAFWCSSAHPDPNPEYACKIKELAESVGFKTTDMMVVNNTGCDIPYPKGYSACKTISTQQYFEHCKRGTMRKDTGNFYRNCPSTLDYGVCCPCFLWNCTLLKNPEKHKSGHGAFWCESAYPDALKSNACTIKKIAIDNKFDVKDLMVANNCNCPNIPFAYSSACKKVSIEDYFSGC